MMTNSLCLTKINFLKKILFKMLVYFIVTYYVLFILFCYFRFLLDKFNHSIKRLTQATV